MSIVGRNDPCPCGSGKKFKRCCVDKRDPLDVALRFHTLDEDVVRAAFRHARTVAPDWDPLMLFDEPDDGLPREQLVGPLAAYVVEVDGGATAADLLLRDRAGALDERSVRWIEAQRKSWLSVWEITRVERGRSLEVVDRLTGEKRLVFERSGSMHMPVRAVILGRVIDFEGLSVFGGIHPSPLTPSEGKRLVDAIDQALGRLDDAFLRSEHGALELIAFWEAALDLREEERARPIAMRNTDGEEFIWTEQHFTLAAGATIESVMSAIAETEDATRNGDDEIIFSKTGNAIQPEWDNTTLGTVRAGLDGIVLQTNSAERNALLAARIERACPGAIVAADKVTQTADELRQRAASQPRRERPPIGEAEREAVQEFLARHYRAWVDHPLPALGGKTPRQAVLTKKGRVAVDEMLKEMEFRESQKPEAEQFELATLRRELRLEADAISSS